LALLGRILPAGGRAIIALEGVVMFKRSSPVYIIVVICLLFPIIAEGQYAIVGSCDTPGVAQDVFVSGDRAYVADGSQGLQVIDINTLQIVGWCDTPDYATDVFVSGDRAYVADWSQSLQFIDINTLQIVGWWFTLGPTNDVFVSGDRAYLANGYQGLQVIDINTFEDVGSCDTLGPANDVFVSGDRAYLANGYQGLQVIDINTLEDVGSCDTPGDARGVFVSGDRAYVADADLGLQVIEEVSTIGDLVWKDLDGDGLQDAGEPGIGGVAVELHRQGDNTPLATKTTDSSGLYSFDNLAFGQYYLKFVKPPGYAFSPKDQGSDNSEDSDADGASGQTDTIILTPGQSDMTHDAGLYQNQIVINEIYPNPVGNDNNDGTASWERVELKNVGTTDFNVGQWTIKDDESPYILATIPDGTTIPAGGYLVVHLRGSSGGGISNNNGDPVILCNSGGVEMDQVSCPASSSKEGLSYSCIPDASDNWDFWGVPTFGGSLSSDPLPGAPNMLTEDYGDALDTFKTLRASDGARHLVIGPYLGSSVDYEPDGQPTDNADGDGADEDGATFSDHIIIGQQSTFSVTASAAGYLQAWIDFNADGDFSDAGEQIAADQALSAGAQTVSFSVPADAKAGYTFARLRFSSSTGLAYYGLASDGEVEDYRVEIKYRLGDYVWVDEDGDGIQDAGETGLKEVTVKLRDAADNIVATQTTDANGKYLFESPAAGVCILEFVPLAGYSITSKDAGTDDEKDSDADPATHRTGPFKVETGVSDLSKDAGFYQPVSISGMKFEDKNGNGARDSGEPGLSGWTIKLMKEGTTVASQDTAADGSYSFTGVVPGSYTVEEVAQPGWTQTCPAAPGIHTITLVSGVPGPTWISATTGQPFCPA
jgi:hypothetical protein